MANGYMPRRDADAKVWLDTFTSVLSAHATLCKATPQEVADVSDAVAAFDLGEGRYVGTFTRTPISIPLTAADDLKYATFIAHWISRKGEAGPPSDPLTLRLDCQFAGARRNLAA